MRINWSKDNGVAYIYNSNSATRTYINTDNATKIDSDLSNATPLDIFNGEYIMINLPVAISLSAIKAKMTPSVSGQIAQCSLDSTDGIDGTWIDLLDNQSYTGLEYKTYTTTPTNCKWIRLGPVDSLFAFHIFGEYQNPRFEVWSADGLSELTGDYPLGVQDIPNSYDYTDRARFKIKNLDIYAHSYSVTITPVRYGGDSVIADYCTVSKDNGATKTSTLTVSNVQPNSLSTETIDVWIDITSANNTADGYHYYSISIEELV